MNFLGDYHLHTFASDGRSSISDYARLAKDRGLKQIAVTDHSFASFMFHMTDGKFAKQEKIIADLGDLGVKIFHGVEANMIGDRLDVPTSVVRRCDILTVGFHRFITPCRMNGQSRFLLVNGFGSSAKKVPLLNVCSELLKPHFLFIHLLYSGFLKSNVHAFTHLTHCFA